MKRTLFLIVLIPLILVGTIAALFAPLIVGTNPMPDDLEIQGVRMVLEEGKPISVLFNIIDAGNGDVVLIDAGIDPTGAPIIKALAEKGAKPEDVKAILITHGHFDHVGAASGAFPNAEVMAFEVESDLISGVASADHSPIGQVLPPKPTGVKVGRYLRDGETVRVGNAEIKVYAIPGHTDGCAAFLVNGLLHLGDAADSTVDGEIKGTAWVISHDVEQSNASLVSLEERLKKENAMVEAIAFSHSGPLTKGLAPLTEFAAKNR